MADIDDIESRLSDVESYYRGATGAARLGLTAAQDADPEQAARSVELEKATGVPATAIYGDLDGFERQNKAEMGSSIVADNHYIADYLNSHPMAPRISHDDIGQLDVASYHLHDLVGKDTALGKWLKRDDISRSFMEGFGDQPLGSSAVIHQNRPEDLEWALSHPAVAALAMTAMTPVELLSRSVSGMVHLGHDGLEQLFGKSFADDAAGTAEYVMMRGDIGVKGGGGGTALADVVGQNAKLIEGMQSVAKGLELADPWTQIGREPPPGIHPLIDEAKTLQAKEDLRGFDAALKESQKSATRERSPEFFANFVRGHLGDREIGISSEAIRGLYGDKVPEVGDNLLGWVPDLDKKLAAAELTGDDIRVPMADWLANIEPDVHKALHDDIRLREGGLTLNETKVEAEPKTVGPDISQQLRGSAGLEPMFSVGDRFVQLKRRPQDPNRVKQPWEEGMHDIDIHDEMDNKIGTINLSEQKGGKELYIEMIQAGSKENKFYQPNYMGPALVRDIARQLKTLFPEAVDPITGKLSIAGHRVSGAREKAGVEMTSKANVKVKLSADMDYAEIQKFRDLLGVHWEAEGQGVESLVKPSELWTAKEKELSQAIKEEAARIIPGVEIKTVSTIHHPSAVGDVKGVYIEGRLDNALLPKIAIALDGAGDKVGVLRHEAIHHLKRMGLFTSDDWFKLTRAARDEGWIKRYDIDRRYPDLDNASKLEEAVAEGYKYWKSGNLILKDTGVFQKIKDFFERLQTRFKEILGKDFTWEELFQKVDEGEVGRREPDSGRGERMQPAASVEEPTGSETSPGLYDRGKALGVTQAHMDRMLRLIEKRNAEDLQAASRRAELRQRRRSNKEYKERRTVLRDEVREDLKSRPDLAMDELFAKQKIKLNPDYLSDDQKARLPKDYIQRKDGVNPDDLAPYFGYTSGDALVERLGILTEDRRRAGMSQRDYLNRVIDVETDRRLNQEFGDREANILDEAKDQALSETQLDLVHEETLAYALKAGQEPQFTKEQVREMVRSVFKDTPIGQISSDRLLQNAGKIGKRIEEAGAKGDWETAYRLSQQRNHTVIAAKFARDYEKARKSFDRTAKTFSKREVPSVPAEYMNWIHSVLLAVERPVKRSIQDLQENIGRQGEQTLRDFAEAKEAEWMGMRELPISDLLLDPAFHKNLSDLTHEEFMGIKMSLDALIKAGRDERKIYREGEAYDREQAVSEMRDKLATFGYKPSNVEPSRIGKWPRAFIYGLSNMETLLNRWDRGDPRGIFNRLVMRPLSQAANGKAALQREIASAYGKLSKPKDLDKLVEAPFPDPMSRTPQNPEGAGPWPNFRRSHVLAMLQNAGNKGNWKVLAHGYGVEPEGLMKWLIKNTTKEDWDRAQAMGDTIFKKLIDKADNVYERMTGATIEKIPLEPIDTPYGQYKGWYHPLVADAQRKTVWVQDPDTGAWSQKAQGKKEMLNDEDFFHFSTSNGYTKRRTGAIYPLDLNFNMVPTRVKQMIHDISFREVIHDTQKIFGDRRFREDVSKYYGSEYADGMMPYLRAVAGAEGIPSKGLAAATGLSELLRQNVISTYIGFNPFTVMKHGPTAAVMSSREVGTTNFFNAVKTLYAQAPSVARITSDFIMKNSEEIQRRERHWQDTIAGQGREITGAGNLREKVIQAGSAAVAWSDMVSAKPTWLAAYNKYLADGLSHGESVALAERAVRRAHGSTAETNQPPLVRGGGPLHGWLTSVYGFFGTAMQRRIETAHKLNDAWQLGKEKEIGQATKKLRSAFTDFMTYMIWPTIVEEVVQGIGTDDHRTWGTKLISGATMGAASSVLYLRDLVHGMISGHEPGVGMLSSALHDVNNVARDATKGREAFNKQHAAKTVGDILTVAGESTGMLPKVVANTARYGINVASGQEKPKSIADVLLGATKGTQKRRVEK